MYRVGLTPVTKAMAMVMSTPHGSWQEGGTQGALSKCITPHWAQVPHTAWRVGEAGQKSSGPGAPVLTLHPIPLTGLGSWGRGQRACQFPEGPFGCS